MNSPKAILDQKGYATNLQKYLWS